MTVIDTGADPTFTPLRPHDGRRVRVAIAGGGFAAAEALIALRTLAGDRVSIDLVSASRQLALRPLAVAAPFGMESLRGVPLTGLCADHQATLHDGTATFVDVVGGVIETDRQERVPFDAAIIAVGSRTVPTVEGAVVGFDGLRGIDEVRRLVGRVVAGTARIAFAVPQGVTWALPAYELALMTAQRARGPQRVVLVTPESAPLEAFGGAVSERVRALLAERGVELVTDAVAQRLLPAGLATSRGMVAVDHVVALPRIEGPRIPGLPSDPGGFLRTDEHGRVEGTPNIYAAGDVTAFPLKQGGLATQQADAAAAAIASRAGAPVEPEPFAPVLRAMLLTGSLPLFLRGPGPAGEAASERPLYTPVGKVAARHLGPWLRDRTHARLGTAEPFADRPGREGMAPAEREAAMELALNLADDEAAGGDPERALRWLEAAEAVGGALPQPYVERRRRWSEEASAGAQSARTT